MTVRADDGTWTFEKLSTMTADTCIVIRIVSYVGKLSDFLPIPGRNLMAGIAFSLVFSSSMGKLRVVDAAAWLSRRSGSSAGIALLCHRVAVRGQQPAESDHSTERRKQTVKRSKRMIFACESAISHLRRQQFSITYQTDKVRSFLNTLLLSRLCKSWKSHPRKWVDRSDPVYKKRRDRNQNSPNGSWGIVQIRPPTQSSRAPSKTISVS